MSGTLKQSDNNPKKSSRKMFPIEQDLRQAILTGVMAIEQSLKFKLCLFLSIKITSFHFTVQLTLRRIERNRMSIYNLGQLNVELIKVLYWNPNVNVN
jgi:hypothetical protein